MIIVFALFSVNIGALILPYKMMEQMPKAVPLLNDFAINKIYLFFMPFCNLSGTTHHWRSAY